MAVAETDAVGSDAVDMQTDWPDVNMIKSPNERRADSHIIR